MFDFSFDPFGDLFNNISNTASSIFNPILNAGQKVVDGVSYALGNPDKALENIVNMGSRLNDTITNQIGKNFNNILGGIGSSFEYRYYRCI